MVGEFAQGGGVPSLVSWSAGAAPSGASSASCYDTSEDVGVFSVVVPEGELSKVQRQILLAYLMVVPDHAALEQAPEVFQIVRVDTPTDVLAGRMPHNLMLEGSREIPVCGIIVCGKQIHFVRNGLMDELVEGLFVCAFDDLANDIPLAGDCANHADLAASKAARPTVFLAPVTVSVLASEECFVQFDFAHEFVPAGVLHGCADSVAHVPRGFVGTSPKHSVNLKGAHTFLTLCHEEDDFEPIAQRILGVLEDGPADNRETASVLVASLADPVERAVGDVPYFDVAALGTGDTVGPTAFDEILPTGFLVGELGKQLIQRHHLHPTQEYHDLAVVSSAG